MNYDFDTVIDRRGTSSIKYDCLTDIWGRDDLTPLWVADMDFPTAPFVREAISRRLQHPILGYTTKPASYYQAIIGWLKSRYGLSAEPSDIHYTSGIVPGLGLAINCFTQPGDKILVQPPVYHPFMWLIQRNHRTMVTNPLTSDMRMDLDDFRQKVRGCKVFILCNPHNPGGVVWTHDELDTVARICCEEGVLVLSDEIHADLTLPPRHHVPFACISQQARLNSVTFMSPSKAFNMPGIAASHALVFNPQLEKQFREHLDTCEYGNGHVFSFTTVEAAYTHGTDWLDQCLAYINDNIDFVIDFLTRHCPAIKARRPEASFLVWLDCRDLHLSQQALNQLFVDKAHLALNDGSMFGANGEGDGFMRLNVACPRIVLQQALAQLSEAIAQL